MSRYTFSSALLLSATGLLLFVAGTIFFPSERAGGRHAHPRPPSEKETKPRTAPEHIASGRSPSPSTTAGKRSPGKRPPLPPEPRSVEEVTELFAGIARSRYAGACRRGGIAWPPKRLVLLAFKREKTLEVWGGNESGRYARLATHPVLAASGGDGPKRRQGDEQVPEGFYDLTELNPNSAFHLSIRVDYPNQEDIRNSSRAIPAMGGDIYIHGNQLSIGCLAIGDRGIEELFTLAALIPPGARRIIIAPFDFRKRPKAPLPDEAPWVLNLYGRMKKALREFPVR